MSDLKKQISLKLCEYESLFSDGNNEFYGKDFRSNYKFVNGAINRMLKQKESPQEILKFINDCIKYHKKSYGLLLLSQNEYFKIIKHNALCKER